MTDDLLIGRDELRSNIKTRNIIILVLAAVLILAIIIGYMQYTASQDFISDMERRHSEVMAHSDTARTILSERIIMLEDVLSHNDSVMNALALGDLNARQKRNERIRYISNRELDIVIARDSIWAKITREQPWD